MHLKYNSLYSQNHRILELEGALETIPTLLQVRKPGPESEVTLRLVGQPMLLYDTTFHLIVSF